MTIEEKNILIKELCMRIPYGVKCNINGGLCKEKDTGVTYHQGCGKRYKRQQKRIRETHQSDNWWKGEYVGRGTQGQTDEIPVQLHKEDV